MKNFTNYSTCLLIAMFVGATFLVGCSRRGCTYPQANNYNPNADTDDGSCYFYGSSVVYLNQGTADSLTNDNAQYLTLTDDYGFSYYIYSGQFSNTEPDCYDYNWPIFQGNEIFTERQITLTDQTGHNYGTFTLPILGGECTNFRLTGLNWK